MVFMAQFLFRLELDMSVKGVRGSGFNFTFYLDALGHEPSGYMTHAAGGQASAWVSGSVQAFWVLLEQGINSAWD